jgi:hypothetical protein
MAVLTNQAPYEVLMPGEEAGPPGALLFIVRYARQAVAASPDQPHAYTQLAAAYNYIAHTQEDRWVPASANRAATPRQDLRRVQITTALEQYLKLRFAERAGPEDRMAHQLLMEAYSQLNYLDLAQEHRKFIAAMILGAGPENGQTVEAFRQRSEDIAKQIQQYDEDLNKRRNSFEVAAQNQPLVRRVQIALGHGLGQRALQLLLEADMTQFKEDEIRLVLELLLSQGRAADVLQQMREEFRRFLGMSYDWYKAQSAAAMGNYEESYQALEGAIDHLENMCIQSAMQLSASQIIHGESGDVITGQRTLIELRRQQADFITLAGIVALEQGEIARARDQFSRALGMGAGHGFVFESLPIARRYLDFIQAAGAAAPK